MVVPGLPDAGLEAVLQQAHGATHDPGVWRLLRWNPGSVSYREFPEIDTYSPGMGMWLISASGDEFALKDGQIVKASGPRTIVLEPKRNQVGAPFCFAVPWDTIQAVSGLAPSEVDGPVA